MVRRSYHIFLACLLCQLLDTPTRCRDRRFQTQAADDLLEYGIRTPLDRAAGSDAIAVFYIGTVQPSQLSRFTAAEPIAVVMEFHLNGRGRVVHGAKDKHRPENQEQSARHVVNGFERQSVGEGLSEKDHGCIGEHHARGGA